MRMKTIKVRIDADASVDDYLKELSELRLIATQIGPRLIKIEGPSDLVNGWHESDRVVGLHGGPGSVLVK